MKYFIRSLIVAGIVAAIVLVPYLTGHLLNDGSLKTFGYKWLGGLVIVLLGVIVGVILVSAIIRAADFIRDGY